MAHNPQGIGILVLLHAVAFHLSKHREPKE
jgi:hypothetical protein